MNLKPKKIVEKVLDVYCLPIKSFQNYINDRYSGKLIPVPEISGTYYHCNGINFNINKEIGSIQQVLEDYIFDDINPNDVVLDIGANIGAFSLFASKKCKRVLSVEPIFTKELKDNIRLNNAKNIDVLDVGLGNGKTYIKSDPLHDGPSKYVECRSLSEIISMFGERADFLKIDCEGGEWCIKANELRGIRRIEAEVHNFDGKHDFRDFRRTLDLAGFEYTYSEINDIVMLIHATRKS